MRGITSMILSFLGGIVGAIAFLGVVGANPAPQKAGESAVSKSISTDSIVTRHLDIVDEDGKRVISLAMIAGTPSILLNGKESEGVTIDLRGISIQDTNGTRVIGILARGKAGSQIAVTDRDRKATVMLAAAKNGGYVMVSPPESLNPSLSLNYLYGKAAICVNDAGGQTRVLVGQTPLVTKSSGVKEETPVGSVTVFDEVGNVVWRVPR